MATKTLDQAIAQMEGYNVSGSLAQRNNNPGNLRAGAGMIGTDANGLAIFPDASTGWAALDQWIQKNSSLTLSAAVDKYLGIRRDAQGNITSNVDQNNPTAYLNGLTQMTGMDASATLGSATTSGGDPTMTIPADTTTDEGSSGFPIDLASVDPTILAIAGIGIFILGFFMMEG